MNDDFPIVIFWSDEDQAYIAGVPDLKYCSAHGRTAAEALAEVERARDAWLASARAHGDPIPSPTPPARFIRAS